jgi:hypothetical protein
MQDGYKVYTDSYMALEWIMFHGHLDYFQKPPLEGRPKTKPEDHGTLKRSQPLVYPLFFYHV